MLTDCRSQLPKSLDSNKEIFEEKKNCIDTIILLLAGDSVMEDFEGLSVEELPDLPEVDLHVKCNEFNALIVVTDDETKAENSFLNEYPPSTVIKKNRERHQDKIRGIVYKETPVKGSAKGKPKRRPWAYYITDSNIVNFIEDGNVARKWNIDTFVLRDLHTNFKVAKKVLYHATMEDAIRTKEKFISDLEALLENRATQEQRAFLLSNSKTKYQEGLADSKLSHFDYRLKVFMEVLRDPQHQETILERAKEFITNVKSPRVNMETEAASTSDVAPRSKRTKYAINYVHISRSSPTLEEDVIDLLWSMRSIASVLFNLTLLCAVWGSFVIYACA